MLVTVDPGPARDMWVPLLELADEPVPLSRYLNDGDLYGEVDDAGTPLAAVLVITVRAEEAELRAVAVAETEQGRGRGTKIVESVFGRLRDQGVREVVVGTASSGVRQLAFYQRLGFRLTHIEPDFFSAEKGYPPGLEEDGIPTRDMVWMRTILH